MMNIGIIGLGKMGLLHSGILNSLENVKITSICEKESIISKYIKQALPQVTVYEDVNRMLNEDLDAIYITTPIKSHFPMIQSCCDVGLNFFTEKPMTRNFSEARELCSKLNNSKIVSMIGYNKRFLDTFTKAKEMLDSKVVGDILDITSTMYVSSIFSKSSGWRVKNESGGGVLLEFTCHLIDLLIWYFGLVEKVECNIESIYSKEVEDKAHLKLYFQDNLQGEIDTSWSIPGYRIPETNIVVNGSKGTLRVNEDFIDIKLKEDNTDSDDKYYRIYKQELNKGVMVDLGGPDYTKEDLHFINCVKDSKDSMINVLEASKSQALIEAAYKSHKSQSQLKVNYFE